MERIFYTDKELAQLLGVSQSLIRKMEKHGPSRRGSGVLDIRLIRHFTVGNMRRWDAKQVEKTLGIAKKEEQQ